MAVHVEPPRTHRVAPKVATLPGITPQSSTQAVNAAIMANKLGSAEHSSTRRSDPKIFLGFLQ
jgi:hypothetical protein